MYRGCVFASSPSSKPVILFAYYYLPDNTSGVQRAVRFSKYLPKFGHNCYVVCSNHQGSDRGNPGVFHVPNGETSTPSTVRMANLATRIQRAILPYNEELPWVPHAVAMARSICRENPVQAVISTSPPAATHLAAFRTKKAFGLRWIADFRDPILGNPGRSRRWARPYDSMLQRFIFRNCDAVIAVTDAVADEWRRAYPQWRSKIHVIWNGYDPEDGFGPKPLPDRPFRLCSHVGVLYGLRHPTALLSSMNRLTQQGKIDPRHVKLQFVGPIQNESALLGHADVQGLIEGGCLAIRNELVPRKVAMDEIATSDYLLLIDIVNLSRAGYTVPAKLYDYVLAGRPILAVTQKDSPVDRILARSGPLYVSLYHDDSTEVIAAKLLEFFALPADPVPPSDWFATTFDGQRQAAALSALIDSFQAMDQASSV